MLSKHESFLNESNFSSFLSLCIHSGSWLGKIYKQFLYKNQYQFIFILSVIWLGMMQLKYNSSDNDIGTQMMQSKKKSNWKM